ncbi:MAG: kelch repeat-containing protein, partial [Myxococcota bacterium]
DSVIDSGEVCDDGNLISGDGDPAAGDTGCSGDCLSDQTCGNGYSDVAAGELCDDGNSRQHDGCTELCTAELPTWITEETSSSQGRETLAVTYDESRQRFVIFGGSSGMTLGDTIEIILDASVDPPVAQFEVKAPAHSPSPRRLANLVYDAARQVVVLHGGREDQDARGVNDTWEYDGVDWTKRVDGIAPSIRSLPYMGYDPQSQRVILFGGQDPELASTPEQSFLNDTWALSATGWERLTTTQSPAARSTGSAGVDRNGTVATEDDRLLIFGGSASGVFFSDTWQFEDNDWVLLETPQGQGICPRARGLMVTAPARAVMVGGVSRLERRPPDGCVGA